MSMRRPKDPWGEEKSSNSPMNLFHSPWRGFRGEESKMRFPGDVEPRRVGVLGSLHCFAEGEHGTPRDAIGLAQQCPMDWLTPLIIGLAICFFGGCFTMLIAMVDVVRLTCWYQIKRSIRTLYVNYCYGMEASRKDDLLDENKDAIPDVQQLSTSDLFSRKIGVFLKSMDPVAVNEALRALLLAFMATIAALNDRFTNALSLGCNLADAMCQIFPLEGVIEDALDVEHKKFAGIITNTLYSVTGTLVSWVVRRYTITLHCAISGAQMFLSSAIFIGKQNGIVDDDLTLDSSRGKLLIAIMSSAGFLWQVSNNFTLPFPLNVLLLPITLLDSLIAFVFHISTSSLWV